MLSGGSVMSFMNAKQTQKMAIYLVVTAVRFITLTCYTFDLDELTNALSEAAERSVNVTVIADKRHCHGGTTKFQADRMNRMRQRGVRVLLADGLPIQDAYGEIGRKVRPGMGIQHSKVMVSDDHMIVGSTNWTTSSRSNHELSVLNHLTSEGQNAWCQWSQHVRDSASELSDEIETTAEGVRLSKLKLRAASTEQHERFRTAKRFSLSRARAQSADAAARESRCTAVERAEL
jgi:phosphatidylserine/phosphatidylglycerophosphate/cardiolipin synthase-like enzyme